MNQQKLLFGLLGILFFVVAANLVMGQNEHEKNVEQEEGDYYKKLDYKYVGESEHWRGEYVIEGEEVMFELDGRMERDYWHEDESFVEYKGDINDLKSVEHLEIKLGSRSSRSTYEDESPQDTVFNLSHGSDDVFNNPEKSIEVEVIWNGQSESFQLVREDLQQE
ncbi:hypothetical protein GMD78_18005 [Ornithinibacillus sp. L9]|uniref:Uncharacterized protein n=1 Tax=Ornithinibacillus caprae TaxID=2678566 RepID=A0A6N8FM73_9BACI|nr:hypothetical protein [Ornithinibacillus caprae]MUK90271.1 hypothetical protein [Ornithinibacillus caprae]